MKLSERKRNLEKKQLLQRVLSKDISMASRIETLEAYIAQMPQAEIPVEETFGDGVYVREIVVPRGTVAVGAIHLFNHVSIMISGELIMWTEYDGLVHLKGYNRVAAKSGVKRAGYFLEDTRWVTAHGVFVGMDPNNMRPHLTVASQSEYNEFKATHMLEGFHRTRLTDSRVARPETGREIATL